MTLLRDPEYREPFWSTRAIVSFDSNRPNLEVVRFLCPGPLAQNIVKSTLCQLWLDSMVYIS